MALSSGKNFDPNSKVFSVTLRDKNLPAPQFSVQTKDGNNYIDLAPITRITGDLISIREKEKPYENKIIRSVTATIKDNNEVYFVSLPYTFLGRNIMNSFLGLKSFSNIELSVYKGKPKTEGRPGFSSSALRQNGELVYGKYEYKDLPKIPKVKVNGEDIGDYTDINALFSVEIKSLSETIKNKTIAPDETDNVSTDEPSGEDVPF